MNAKLGTTAALAILMTACGGGAASNGAGTTPTAATMTPSTAASGTQLYDALGIAMERYPSGLPFELEIDDETAHLGFLEVELWVGDEAKEVFIDPGTMAIVDEGVETPEAGEEAAYAETHSRLVAGEGSLRAAMEAGLLNNYDASAVTELEMTILDGHLVVKVTQGGAVTYNEAAGPYLGTADEARMRWQSEAQLAGQ